MKTVRNFSNFMRQQATVPRLLLTVLMVGLGILVISPISPSADFYEQLAAYGDYGRRLYLTRISPVDLFIPLTQALFLAAAISLAARRAFAPDSDWQLLSLLPFVAMLGDYLENVSIAGLMLAYPVHWDFLATVSAGFTAVKFIFSFLSLACVLLCLGVMLGNRRRRQWRKREASG